MNTELHGGPAFPVPPERINSVNGDNHWAYAHPGMTLRDHFAGIALLGYMQSCSLHDQPHLWAPKMAEYAYTQADAMILERIRTAPESSSANTQAEPR